MPRDTWRGRPRAWRWGIFLAVDHFHDAAATVDVRVGAIGVAGREPGFVDVGSGLGCFAMALGVSGPTIDQTTRLAFTPLQPGDGEVPRCNAVVVDLIAKLAGELQEWEIAFCSEVATVITFHQR